MTLYRFLFYSIISIGISSVTTQLLTVREFLASFEGNEMVIGLILFSWLFITGIGSFLARYFQKPSPKIYACITCLIGILPLFQITAIRYGREIVFTHGVSPGLYSITSFIVITVAPYCLVTGFILPFGFVQLRSLIDNFTSGRLYFLDSVGDILGGILFSFILIYFLTPFQIIAFTTFLCLAAGTGIAYTSGAKALSLASGALGALIIAASLHPGFELAGIAAHYQAPIVHYKESQYGRLIVTRDNDQYNFFSSGIPLFSDNNTVENEELIHYALSQRPSFNRVLLVSGGVGGSLVEIAKYNPESVDYVELDPDLIKAARMFGFLRPMQNISMHGTDGRSFIFSTSKVFDAVIIDLPDPDTFQLNRFYTREFFKRVREILSPHGVLCFTLSYYQNYISDLQRSKLASLYKTVSLSFNHVVALPGTRVYFLCSNAPLSADIPLLLNKKRVRTLYIQDYFRGIVTPERRKILEDALKNHPEPKVNSDFSPALLTILFSQWYAKHGTSPLYGGLVILAIFGLYIALIRKEEFALFTTGLSTMGMEIVILFCFQIMYGCIYLKVGIIVTTFLAGLAPGSLTGIRYKWSSHRALLFSEVILAALMGLYILVLVFVSAPLSQWFFIVFGFVFAFWCGFQFPIITELLGEKASNAADCFAADLAGAAFGTLVTATFLIPVAGLLHTISVLILFKLVSLSVNMFASKANLEYTF